MPVRLVVVEDVFCHCPWCLTLMPHAPSDSCGPTLFHSECPYNTTKRVYWPIVVVSRYALTTTPNPSTCVFWDQCLWRLWICCCCCCCCSCYCCWTHLIAIASVVVHKIVQWSPRNDSAHQSRSFLCHRRRCPWWCQPNTGEMPVMVPAKYW